MKSTSIQVVRAGLSAVFFTAMALSSANGQAQLDHPYPGHREIDQHHALDPLLTQIDKFQKSTWSAPGMYHKGGYETLWQNFQAVRRSFSAFKGVLTERQTYEGANDLAELDAGLTTIQESFTHYQSDIARKPETSARFQTLCTTLFRSMKVWRTEASNDWDRWRVVR